MFDRDLTLNTLQQIKTLVDTIGQRTAAINDIEGLLGFAKWDGVA